MIIYLPGPMFAAGISLYLFYKYNRAKEAKLDARRENLKDIRQQYLQGMIEAKKKEDSKSP
jgi:hypothetical protein